MPPALSTAPDGPELRLLTVPFNALAGLQVPLTAALAEVLAGTPAERVVDRLLRAHRNLDADRRQALAEAIFGVGLWRRRLAWHAGLEHAAGPAPQHASILLFVFLRDLAGISPADAAVWSGFTDAAPPIREAPTAFALRFSLPDWLAETLERELGPDTTAFAGAINVPGPITLRANSLVGTREQLATRLADEGVVTAPGRWSPLALHVSSPRPNVFGLAAWREGRFEVQDEGSQLIAAIVGARPGETLLDFCAGAGGKTLQLAPELHGSGLVHAFDIDSERLIRLRARAERARAASNIRIHPQPPPDSLWADAVLVDAPCSELGTLRRSPDLRFRIDPRRLETFPPLQRDLLERAHRHVRPGGRLVYATCTIRREENEEVALDFERAHPEFERVPPPAGWLHESFVRDGFFHAWPHFHGTDGFFASAWIRRPHTA
jgi:16S rRNA (cytosine967-C5)-methyltransferase